MALGHFQIQFFVSMLMIVGAGCVALICDFHKRKNEQLRELTGELKVRREENQKLAKTLKSQAAPKQVETPAANIAAPMQRSMTSPDTVKKKTKRTVNADALAVMQRGAALAGARFTPSAGPEVVVATQPQIVEGATKKDWGSMLSRNAQRTGMAPETLPEGFQDAYVLRNLVESRSPVTGLVVSIGVNESSDAVRGLVESLIGPNDFAAQSREDEFLLIYPEEQGPSAQRKLNEIAEKLWDFELLSLGSLETLFSWGGVEVRSESIDRAIASASERMQETKRDRKLITMSPGSANSLPSRKEI